MRYLLIVACLILAACQTAGPSQSVSEIQRAVRAACAFVPAAKTVAALIGKRIPYGDIISSICVAVGATGGDQGHATYRAHGVKVQGHFVK